MHAIGVISDTHGLLREEAIRALEGSALVHDIEDLDLDPGSSTWTQGETIRTVRGFATGRLDEHHRCPVNPGRRHPTW